MSYSVEQQAANRQLWFAALRSGKYIQGFRCLKQKDFRNPGNVCHCALGVACEVAIENGVKAEWHLHCDDRTYMLGQHSVVLPPQVAKFYGVSATCDYPPSGNVVGLNDGLERTFAQIADIGAKNYDLYSRTTS